MIKNGYSHLDGIVVIKPGGVRKTKINSRDEIIAPLLFIASSSDATTPPDESSIRCGAYDV